jgi:ATP/maltotriose-dependent transcriptional regulator MalT
LAEVLVCQGRVALAEGHAGEAESLARAALDAIEQRSCAASRGPAFGVLARAALLRGDRNAAVQYQAQAVESARECCRQVERVRIENEKL